MFTVLLYDDRLTSTIEEYMPFWKTFLDQGSFAMCRWKREGKTVKAALPELYDAVKEKQEWRAVVLYHSMVDVGKNPYDFFDGSEPAEAVEEEPIIRLTHMLSMVPRRLKLRPENGELLDRDYIYREELPFVSVNEDKDYYKNGVTNYEIECTKPSSILLVATRQQKDGKSYELPKQSDTAGRLRYEFNDRNDYPANVRFLMYDIRTQNEKMEDRSVFQMMHAMLIILLNSFSVSSLKPEGLYRISIRMNEKDLDRQLQKFQAQLMAIATQIKTVSRCLKRSADEPDGKGVLPDLQEQYNVTFPEDDRAKLYLSLNEYGLAKDSPRLDTQVFEGQKKTVDDSIAVLKKDSIRQLKTSVGRLRSKEKDQLTEPSGHYTEYQLEDIRLEMESIERSLFRLDTADEVKLDTKKKLDSEKAIENRMELRTKKRGLALAFFFAMLVFVIGFIPFFISSFGDTDAWIQILLIMFLGILIISFVGVVQMFVDRADFLSYMKRYISLLTDLAQHQKENQLKYQEYISLALNYRKYWYFMYRLRQKNDYSMPDEMLRREIMVKRHKYENQAALALCERIRRILGISDSAMTDYEVEHSFDFTAEPSECGYYRFPIAPEHHTVRINRYLEPVYTGYEYVSGFSLEREEIEDAADH